MESKYEIVKNELEQNPKTWLVTGGAGFIGSNILEQLLRLQQKVVVLDNFATGFRRNIEDLSISVGKKLASNLRLIEGDIRDLDTCQAACKDINIVLHQAALGSVPRSIHDPVSSNNVNICGFLNMATAAKDCGVARFVYASSSSVYGDSPDLPKKEENTGSPLSPYALTKAVNEMYANVFSKVYGFQMIGLRYFNVFGPRQTPDGPYAAVIPKWVDLILKNKISTINGDGSITRDFCYVANAVQANILAGVTTNPEALNRAYNISFGERVTLNELYQIISDAISAETGENISLKPEHGPDRPGDIQDSLADTSLAKKYLGYEPRYSLNDGMKEAISWYVNSAENL